MTNIQSSKGAAVDRLPSRFLKDGANILAKHLCTLQSLNLTESLPKCLQSCGLKPIVKKGKKTDPSNYRPISFLPSVSKIIQRVVFDQINGYLPDGYYIKITSQKRDVL